MRRKGIILQTHILARLKEHSIRPELIFSVVSIKIFFFIGHFIGDKNQSFNQSSKAILILRFFLAGTMLLAGITAILNRIILII
jgi:hypothetical protein